MKLPSYLRHPGCVVLLLAATCVCRFAVADEQQPHQAVLDAEQQRIEAIAKAAAPTVCVFGPGGQGGGSGVVVSPDGYALTNFHVSKPCGDYMKCSLPDGRIYDAVIVGIDPTGDVALIKMLGRDDFPVAEMADSDSVRVGDWCFAIGNPFLLATNLQPTVTYGIVSGVHRYQYPAGTLLEYADCIQTDAAINPGNSGGPLFNAQGELIGINGRGSFEKRGRVNVGVGYAISINQIKNFMGYLRSGRVVDHATLGATVSSDDDGRVIVSNILESSDAYRRGLRYGDEIAAFGGRDIGSVNAFKNVLGIYPRGWRVPLSFRRDGQRRDVLVRLTGVHSRDELIEKVQGALPIEEDEEKRPGRDPQDPQKEGGDEPGDPQPAPQARPQFHKDEPIPEHVAKLIKERRGYANYYFNELNRDRVWDQLGASGKFDSLAGRWALVGETSDGRQVEITLTAAGAAGLFGGIEAHFDATQDFDQQLDPPGSGGLLAALHLWRRLLIEGPGKFGDVYYVGTAPVPGSEGLHDVLAATYNVVQSQFYFEPQSGRIALVEMFADSGGDPCEIYFRDYRDLDGRLVPYRLEVRWGEQLVAEIEWKQIELAPAAEDEA